MSHFNLTDNVRMGSAKVAFLIVSLLVSNATMAALPSAVEEQPLPSLAPMIEKVQSTVVSVHVESAANVRRGAFDDPFFNRFFGQRSSRNDRQRTSSVGVIIDGAQGLILTNEHVIRRARKIEVTLSDGQRVPAQLVGADAIFDMALLKVDSPNLTAITLGDSDALRIGDFVVSIGDQIGENNTLVSGLISAKADKKSTKQYRQFIQSDAALGGGFLVDLHGNLVGLNVAQSNQANRSSARVGFSTPVNMLLKLKDQLVRYGAPQRGFLSIRVQDLTPDLASAFNVQGDGVVVSSVTEGSSAAQAGFKSGDVVTAVDDHPIQRRQDLNNLISQHFAGEELEFKVMRQGAALNLRATLESSVAASKLGNLIHRQLEGATLTNIDNRDGALSVSEGVFVSRVKKGSVAWEHGVRPKDIIISANRKSVKDLDDFRKAIADQDVIMLNIIRGSGALYLLLQ